jgi:hypothetical protein
MIRLIFAIFPITGSRCRSTKGLRRNVRKNGMILTPEKRGSRKPLGEPLGDEDFKGVLSLLTQERGLKL